MFHILFIESHPSNDLEIDKFIQVLMHMAQGYQNHLVSEQHIKQTFFNNPVFHLVKIRGVYDSYHGYKLDGNFKIPSEIYEKYQSYDPDDVSSWGEYYDGLINAWEDSPLEYIKTPNWQCLCEKLTKLF